MCVMLKASGTERLFSSEWQVLLVVGNNENETSRVRILMTGLDDGEERIARMIIGDRSRYFVAYK